MFWGNNISRGEPSNPVEDLPATIRLAFQMVSLSEGRPQKPALAAMPQSRCDG